MRASFQGVKIPQCAFIQHVQEALLQLILAIVTPQRDIRRHAALQK